MSAASAIILLPIGAYFAHDDKSKLTAALCAAFATNPLILHPFIARQLRQTLNYLNECRAVFEKHKTTLKDEKSKNQFKQAETAIANKTQELKALRDEFMKAKMQLARSDTSYCQILRGFEEVKNTYEQLQNEKSQIIRQALEREEQLKKQLEEAREKKKLDNQEMLPPPESLPSSRLPRAKGSSAQEPLPSQPPRSERKLSPVAPPLVGREAVAKFQP
jgi:hypothetical protein